VASKTGHRVSRIFRRGTIMEMALAGIAFVTLFAMWVILPSRARKSRDTQE
jgi:Na+/H+-translocating membrane pyrophosphatase